MGLERKGGWFLVGVMCISIYPVSFVYIGHRAISACCMYWGETWNIINPYAWGTYYITTICPLPLPLLNFAPVNFVPKFRPQTSISIIPDQHSSTPERRGHLHGSLDNRPDAVGKDPVVTLHIEVFQPDLGLHLVHLDGDAGHGYAKPV